LALATAQVRVDLAIPPNNPYSHYSHLGAFFKSLVGYRTGRVSSMCLPFVGPH
jgi:hypothetical protein